MVSSLAVEFSPAVLEVAPVSFDVDAGIESLGYGLYNLHFNNFNCFGSSWLMLE